MKFISIILNILCLITISYLLIKNGFPASHREIFLVIIFIITPIINLLYITIWSGNTWLSLYLKRKMLEEQKKIEELMGK
jgi:Gpi18-like mannosyltransferase